MWVTPPPRTAQRLCVRKKRIFRGMFLIPVPLIRAKASYDTRFKYYIYPPHRELWSFKRPPSPHRCRCAPCGMDRFFCPLRIFTKIYLYFCFLVFTFFFPPLHFLRSTRHWILLLHANFLPIMITWCSSTCVGASPMRIDCSKKMRCHGDWLFITGIQPTSHALLVRMSAQCINTPLGAEIPCLSLAFSDTQGAIHAPPFGALPAGHRAQSSALVNTRSISCSLKSLLWLIKLRKHYENLTLTNCNDHLLLTNFLC